MSSIFSRIIRGEVPAHIIDQDAHFIAFLDISPLKAGHTLVVPKVEVDYIFDMPDEMLAAMMVFAKKVASKIEKAIPCSRIGVAVIGLEVPHAHIHLVPIQSIHDLNFARPKLSLTIEEMADIAARITRQS